MVPLSSVVQHRAPTPPPPRSSSSTSSTPRPSRRCRCPASPPATGWPRSSASCSETLPEGFFIDYSGQSRLEVQQGNTIMIAFALAVAGDLPGARRPVRELPRPVHHPDGGAAVDLRRDPAAQHRPRHPQHLHPGRADHPDRPDHQARHPDGRVRQPAARAARPQPPRRDRRRRQDPPAPDPDDHRRHGARRGAADHRRGRRRRRALLDGPGDLLRACIVGTCFTLFVVPMFYTLHLAAATARDATAWPELT